MLRSGGGGGAASVIEVIGPPGPTGPQGAPGQSYGNALLSGGAIRYVSNLQFVVSQASYVINGTTYSSPETTINLTAADGSNPRIDVIALTSSSTAVAVDGTAAATPAEASIDPLTQLRLTAVTVGAGATSIGVTTTNIYLENTEWTTTVSGAGMAAASTSNPHAGTKDVEATAATAGQYANFSNGSAFDTTTRNFLLFYIRNKAAWASTKSVVIQWYNGTTAVGTPVTLKNGAYGFNHNNVSSYQLIGIPLTAFGVAGLTTTAIRFTVTGGGSAIGFYLDDIVMQGGVTVITPTDAMRYRGAYSSAVQYQINDVVNHGNGLAVALQPTLGNAPGTAYWKGLAGEVVATATYAGTLTVSLANYAGYRTVILDTTLTGAVVFNLTNGTDGQTIIWRVRQDGTGSRTLSYGANIRLGTDITATTLTTTASKMDRIAFEWNSTDGKADVVSFVKGF